MIGQAPHKLPSHLKALLLNEEPQTLEERLDFIHKKYDLECKRALKAFRNEYEQWVNRVRDMRNYRRNAIQRISQASDV